MYSFQNKFLLHTMYFYLNQFRIRGRSFSLKNELLFLLVNKLANIMCTVLIR